MCLQPHSFLNELSDLYNSPPLNSSNSLDRDFNLWKIVSSLNKRHITVYHRSKHRFWECHKYFGLDNFLVSESVLDCTGLLRNRFGKKTKRSLDKIKTWSVWWSRFVKNLLTLFCNYDNLQKQQIYKRFHSEIYSLDSIPFNILDFLLTNSFFSENFLTFLNSRKTLTYRSDFIKLHASWENRQTPRHHPSLRPDPTKWNRVNKIQVGLFRACKSWHFLTHDLRFWFRRSERRKKERQKKFFPLHRNGLWSMINRNAFRRSRYNIWQIVCILIYGSCENENEIIKKALVISTKC